MPPRAPTLKPLSIFVVTLPKCGVVKPPPLGPVNVALDTEPVLLVRLVQPPSGPIYQAPGTPVGKIPHGLYACACASTPPKATASATPAPSRQRFVIPYLRPRIRAWRWSPPYRWPIFPVSVADGKPFLPQPRRSPGNGRRTPYGATFRQQLRLSRQILATVPRLFRNTEQCVRSRGASMWSDGNPMSCYDAASIPLPSTACPPALFNVR